MDDRQEPRRGRARRALSIVAALTLAGSALLLSSTAIGAAPSKSGAVVSKAPKTTRPPRAPRPPRPPRGATTTAPTTATTTSTTATTSTTTTIPYDERPTFTASPSNYIACDMGFVPKVTLTWTSMTGSFVELHVDGAPARRVASSGSETVNVTCGGTGIHRYLLVVNDALGHYSLEIKLHEVYE